MPNAPRKKQYQLTKLPGSSHVILLDNGAVEYFFERGQKRVQAVLEANQKVQIIHAAIMNSKTNGYYLHIGAPVMKALGIKKGDSVLATLQIDETPLQFSNPEELEEVLRTDPAAKQVFDKLTDGNKRGIIALIQQVKSPDKKIERALRIAEKLKVGITNVRLLLK